MSNGVFLSVSPQSDLKVENLIRDLEKITMLEANKIDHEHEPIFIRFSNSQILLTLTENNSLNMPGIPCEDYEYTLDIDAYYSEKRMTHDQMSELLGYEIFNALKQTESYALMLIYGVEAVLAQFGTPRPIDPENSVIARERKQVCNHNGADYLFLPLDSILWATPDLNGKWGGVTVQGSRYLPNDTHSGWVLWTGDEEPNEQTEFVQIVAKDVDEWRRIPTWLLGLAPGWRFIQDAKSHADKIWYDETLLSVPPSYRLL